MVSRALESSCTHREGCTALSMRQARTTVNGLTPIGFKEFNATTVVYGLHACTGCTMRTVGLRIDQWGGVLQSTRHCQHSGSPCTGFQINRVTPSTDVLTSPAWNSIAMVGPLHTRAAHTSLIKLRSLKCADISLKSPGQCSYQESAVTEVGTSLLASCSKSRKSSRRDVGVTWHTAS
jgi:hypothetical protein